MPTPVPIDWNTIPSGTPGSSDWVPYIDNTTGTWKKAHPASFGGGGGSGDTTPPTVVSKTVENATPSVIDVVMSESVSGVSATGWSAKKNGSAWTISSVTGSGTTWHFTMATSAANGDTLVISYDSSTGSTLDGSANELVTFTDSAVTNNVAASSDSDAVAFWTAAGISNTTQRTAINNFVVAAKANGYWSKLKAIYPIIGGAATPHSYNLKNPSLYQITWFGTITHNATGIRSDDLGGGNGNGYGHTGFIPSANLTAGSTSLAFWCVTNQDNGNQWPIGCVGSGVSGLVLQARNTNNAGAISGSTGVMLSTANSNSTGFFTGVRASSTSLKIHKNGTQLGTTLTTSDTNALPGVEVYLLGYNNNGSNGSNDYGKFFSFFSIGDALTDTDVSNFSTDVAAMQTTLGR